MSATPSVDDEPRQKSADGANAGMTYHKLGSSDLMVSSCCLGTMTWGNQNTDAEAADQLSAAWDAGVNFLDTAEGYPVPMTAETQGATDRAIAKWMKATRRPRDEVIIATKVCGRNERFTWFRDGPTRVTREQIFASVDASLERLGTDYLDLLQIHWPDRYVPMFGTTRYDVSKERDDEVPFAEQARAMADLVKAGKIRHWGLSNETPFGVCEFIDAARAEGAPPPVSVQNSYSLLQRTDEHGLVEAMRRHDVGYLPYSPLSAGVLSGKYRSGSPNFPAAAPPPGSRLALFGNYFDRYMATDAPQAVDAYYKLAVNNGLTPTALAIAFCESRPFVTSTIIGATTRAQLDVNLTGFGVEWNEDLEQGVQAVLDEFPDPWRMLVRDGG
jgi:aryl-alcohol dehydrogenase-like predicted oxidoreductase